MNLDKEIKDLFDTILLYNNTLEKIEKEITNQTNELVIKALQDSARHFRDQIAECHGAIKALQYVNNHYGLCIKFDPAVL